MNFDKKLQDSLATLFKARFPYVYIPTWEEKRAIEFIRSIAYSEDIIKHERMLYIWAQTTGFVSDKNETIISKTTDPIDAMNFVLKSNEDAIFVFKDLHVFFGIDGRNITYEIVRKMRDIIPELHEGFKRKNIVLISPRLIIPEDLQKDIAVFDFPLPNAKEIISVLDEILEENSLGQSNLSAEDKEKLGKAALGLTLQEAENAFSRAIVQNHGISKDALKIIFDEKNQVIKKTGILEFVNSNLTIDDIGGLENLKSWLLKRKNAWLDSAKKYNIPAPKGVLITGVPGCGKSLTAKAVSSIWQLPLLKLDIGRIFSGIVGSSEENMRKAIATAEAVAPSVLWIDEIEKGLGRVEGAGDSGTSARIFATFLTWMQEKTKPVFVIATANDISKLPPELLRKGRFDEIFFVDLPTEIERKNIFKVHLKKRVEKAEISEDIEINEELLESLSKISVGFSGSEIEQAVISSLYEAFFHERNLRVEDLENAVRTTIPIAVTQKEQIKSLRAWASVRAVSATPRDDLASYKVEDGGEDIELSRGGRMLDV